jgi:hypothetical protein
MAPENVQAVWQGDNQQLTKLTPNSTMAMITIGRRHSTFQIRRVNDAASRKHLQVSVLSL